MSLTEDAAARKIQKSWRRLQQRIQIQSALKKLRKRHLVIQELLNTENVYYSSLCVTLKVLFFLF